MGQIPCSTERISCYCIIFYCTSAAANKRISFLFSSEYLRYTVGKCGSHLFSENNPSRAENWGRMHRREQTKKQRLRREVSRRLQCSGEKYLHFISHKTLTARKKSKNNNCDNESKYISITLLF